MVTPKTHVKESTASKKTATKSLEQCISRIEDKQIRAFVAKAVRSSPKYFWTASSSTSGKHHPVDEHGVGGLVLHTVRVFNVAESLIPSLISCTTFGAGNPDVIRAGAILHDIRRYGLQDEAEAFTNKDHPELAAKVIREMDAVFPQKRLIAFCVERHMGRWGQILPNSTDEWLVHFADTIATKYYPQQCGSW